MIEILLNDVTLEGMRRVKVGSDSPFDLDDLPITLPFPRGERCQVRTLCDEMLGLHYLEATSMCREAIMIRCEGWKCPRPFVLWKLAPGERVSEVLGKMMALFGERFKCFPDHAFMKKMPKGIENGFEVDDVMLIEAEWVPAGCIAVGNGG